MLTIDCQVHAYEQDHAARPWVGTIPGPPSVTGPQMLAAMAAVGVDAAVLVSPYALYRYDASFAVAVHAAHPDRFALVKPVDPAAPDVREIIADWAVTPGAVAIRLMLNTGLPGDAADPGINAVLSHAARHALPVNLLCSGRLEQVRQLAARNPDTVLVIDHLGLQQPFAPPVPPAPWADLPDVLALARYANVVMKISGACTLATTPYPYPDIWDPIGRILDAFGLERCMWGTDWTRAIAFLTYREGVEAFRNSDRLSQTDLAMLMGGTVQRVYDWSPNLP